MANAEQHRHLHGRDDDPGSHKQATTPQRIGAKQQQQQQGDVQRAEGDRQGEAEQFGQQMGQIQG
jgi:hypothetical protein